ALMILRAAGLSRAKPQQKTSPQKTYPQKASREQGKSLFMGTPSAAESIKGAPSGAISSSPLSSMKELPSKETVSLFVSMGKRHHLKPQDLRNKIAERTGLSLDAIGRVHLLEKYSFVEVPVEEAQKVIAAMNGAELNGHALEIKPAKKRAKTSSKG
ncbi:MAG TPA: DbpA RNA binding domain-containing protein, partial [Rectinema sp.]|nr:DbpA RNA binding domain-containing protein [Rectinema sp.]